MPKAPTVDGKALAALITEHKSKIFNDVGALFGPTAKVWEDITAEVASKLGKTVSAFYVYAFVKQGRCGVTDLLSDTSAGSRQLPNPDNSSNDAADESGGVTNSVSQSHDNSASNASLSSSSDPEGITSFSSGEVSPSRPAGCETFSVPITAVQWEKIKPVQKSYKRRDRATQRSRQYAALQQGWADLFAARIWDVTKKPCCWSFARSAHIRPSGRFYLTASAFCTECRCQLQLRLAENPDVGSPLQIKLECLIIGYAEKSHTGKAKRHLTGEARSSLGLALLERNVAASKLRKQKASQLMLFGDDEPPVLPNLDVMRHAKMSSKKSLQLDPNPVLALLEAKHSPALQGAIKDLAVDRFYCHYWSTSQMQVYQLYCKKEASVLMLDATGGIAHRLKKPGSSKGGNIFLYQGVVKCSESDQVAVVQMVSERHDGAGIEFWLSSWIRDGAPVPKQAVCDMSLALVGAIVRAFTNLPHLQAYVDALWRIVQREPEALPQCHIRLDVAHFVKRVASWKSLNGRSTNRRVKDFYLRCVGQLVLSDKLSSAELIIKALIIVARSETNGKNTDSGNPSLCEGRKQFLKTITANGFPAALEAQLVAGGSEAVNAGSTTADECTEDSDLCALPTSFGTWVDNLDQSCQQLLSSEPEGDDANACWNPQLVADLKRVCRLLPLWSGVAAEEFGHRDLTGSSAGVEAEFGNIKARDFSNLPLRVDEFVLEHLSLLDGAMKLAAARAQRSNAVASETANNNDFQPNRLTQQEQQQPQHQQQQQQQDAASTGRTRRIRHNSSNSLALMDLAQCSGFSSP